MSRARQVWAVVSFVLACVGGGYVLGELVGALGAGLAAARRPLLVAVEIAGR